VQSFHEQAMVLNSLFNIVNNSAMKEQKVESLWNPIYWLATLASQRFAGGFGTGHLAGGRQ
jgi:hypothetical protein